MLRKILLLVTLSLSLTTPAIAKQYLQMELKDGNVLIELYPDKAPKTVERIVTLTNKGFYNNLTFHRVISGFMAQTGDPTGTGSGGSDLGNLKGEMNDIHHTRGICSMARAYSMDSANSQFFIVFADAPHLDRQYAAWGRVVSGMDFVDNIKKGDQRDNGRVTNPDKIIKMTVIEK